MKILIVLYYYHPYVSGLSLLAKMQAEGLAARGHEITVLTMRYQNELPAEETLNGVQVVRAKVRARLGKGVVSWEFLRKIVELSRSHDVINPHLPMAHFGLILPFVDPAKIVVQYHCDLNLGGGLLASLLQKFSQWSMERTLERSSGIIATTRDYFSSCRFAKYSERVQEIYPPIDPKRFGRRDPSDLKTRLGVSGDPFLIGFVGRVVAEKGLEYLLRAIPPLEKRVDDFLVLIAGDYTRVAGGSVKDEIDGLVREFPGRVRFIGHLRFDDLVAFYNLIDVLVLPSVDPLEAFGMVQVEAMLCGTPVIATDMPGVREVVRKTGFGKLVRKRDPRDIADKVIELIHNPVTIDRGALADFDIEHSLDKYESIFQQCCGQVGPEGAGNSGRRIEAG